MQSWRAAMAADCRIGGSIRVKATLRVAAPSASRVLASLRAAPLRTPETRSVVVCVVPVAVVGIGIARM